MKKITIVDDHQLFREGMKRILMTEKDTSIASCGSSEVELKTMMHDQPDIILLDNDIRENVFKVIRFIHKERPTTKIIMLTLEANRDDVLKALSLGVSGYILKDTDIETLYKCIKVVSNGQSYIHYMVANVLLDEYRKITSSSTYTSLLNTPLQYQPPYHLLSKRECEILQLLAEGLSNRSIGYELSISEMTVKNHVSNIMKKINVHDRTAAVLKAIKRGWVRFNYRDKTESLSV